MWKDEVCTALNPVKEQEKNELVCRIPQKPHSCLFPHCVPVLGWEKGTCPFQGSSLCLAQAGSSWALSVQESLVHVAAELQGSRALPSAPPPQPEPEALSHMPKPDQHGSWRALTPPGRGSVSLGCALASTLLLPDSQCSGRSCPCLWLRRAWSRYLPYGFFSV